MADETLHIDVQVNTDAVVHDLAAATKEVERLKAQQKDLEKQYKAGTISVQDYVKALAENKKQLDLNQRAVKSNTAVLQVAGNQILDTTKSLDEQRNMINAAQKAYASLSGDAKVLADQEGGLRDQIKEAVDALKEQEHAIGDDRRNVGNYTESMKKAFDQMGEAAGILGSTAGLLNECGAKGKAAGKVFQTLQKVLDLGSKTGKVYAASANAAATATTAQATATKGATTAQVGLNAAMAANPLGMILSLISLAVSAFLALKDIIEDNTEAMDAHAAKLEEVNRQLENQEKILTQLQQRNREGLELMQAQGASSEALHKQIVQNLKDEKAQAEQNVTFAEQQRDQALAAWNQAKLWHKEDQELIDAKYASYQEMVRKYEEMERSVQSFQHQIDVENAKFETQQAQDAERKRQAAASRYASIARQRKEALENEREELVKRDNDDLQNELRGYRQAMEKELAIKGLTEEEKARITAYYMKKGQDAIQREVDAVKKANDEKVKKEEEFQKQKAEAREKALLALGLTPGQTPEELELATLQKYYDDKLIMEEEFQQAKALIQAKYQKQADDAMAESIQKQKTEQMDAAASMLASGESVFNALSELVGEYAEDNEDAARAQKALAIGGIIVNQASSIASGVSATAAAIDGAMKAAAQTGIAAPFTAPAFIAEMVGIVATQIANALAGITKAKSVLSTAGKYENGGIIPGTSYHGDNLRIAANSSEMVLTREQQTRLFDIANGGRVGDLSNMASVFSAAVASLPAPVMDYREFTDFQSNVSTYKEFASI